MAANLLIDRPPSFVTIDNEHYEIRSDFRTSILFEILMQDDELDDTEKILNALRLYYPVVPSNIPKAIDEMLWFYGCGKEKVKSTEESEEETEEDVEEDSDSGQRIYSFEHDDEYIYAAFLQQYGIDLTKVKYMHWWKFRALFKSLSDQCEFVKIMGYRSIKTTSKMSPEQRRFYNKMKSIHALPLSTKEQEYIDKITYALMHGGDLAGLV